MADSLDPCPVCGEEFDHNNAGARTNHVRACREKKEKYSQGGGREQPQQAQQAEQAEVEAIRPTEDQSQQQGELPANQTSTAGEGIGTGIASALDDDAPIQQRAEGVKEVASLAGGLLSGIMQHREQKEQRQKQRAKSANIEKVEDKPQCGECGAVFSKIPETADRIQCPHCGVEYRVK
jgi:hypothetical protein